MEHDHPRETHHPRLHGVRVRARECMGVDARTYFTRSRSARAGMLQVCVNADMSHRPLRCHCSRPSASSRRRNRRSVVGLKRPLPVQSHSPQRCDQTWRPGPETRPLRTQIEQRTLLPRPTSNRGGKVNEYTIAKNFHDASVLPGERYRKPSKPCLCLSLRE